MKIWGKTDQGAVRSDNQDFYCMDLCHGNSKAVMVLCDGMGGANAGQVASKLAAEAISGEVHRRMRRSMNAEYMKSTLTEAVKVGNETVFRRAEEDPECAGMGTTAVAVLADVSRAVIANVGDSRAYLVNEEGITRITNDHSLVEEMLSRGEITREEAKNSNKKNYITRAVGTEAEVTCDLFEIRLFAEDRILLCSDGLSNLVDEQEILYEVTAAGSDSDCCERLVKIALSRGAPDNVTVLLLKI